MIARLALAEANIVHNQVLVDIHVRGSHQSPAYARLNRNMTVPTLILPDRILGQSRDILRFAFVGEDADFPDEIASWVDRHYAFPIEDLTFGHLLAHHALARAIIPARMAATHRRLLRLAVADPDLSTAYEDRAAVFDERQRTFDIATAKRLESTRRAEATALLDRLEDRLADGRQVIVPPIYSAADVVWTVFLARMELIGMADEIARRPALSRYHHAMRRRPSFAAADIWTRLHIGRLVRAVIMG